MKYIKWTQEYIIEELNNIISLIKHFPTSTELVNKNDNLYSAISRYGGINYFRRIMGYDYLYKPDTYWTKNNTITELKIVIDEIKHFPKQRELCKMNKNGLVHAITKHGGLYNIGNELGYKQTRKPRRYWSKENTTIELKQIIKSVGRFPSCEELIKIDSGLVHAITKHGGFVEFRKDMGYSLLKHEYGYWTDEKIIEELREVVNEINRFPTVTYLKNMNKKDLVGAIYCSGRIIKFRETCGFSPSVFDKYRSELSSYITKRGKKTEVIVEQIIKEYCKVNELNILQKNVRLSKGSIIEFVCNANKTIGIDVTNTESKGAVSYKWTKKDYYKYLDELWIVVVSDSFTKDDYIKWNKQSPGNVYVMDIDNFIDELEYDLDEATKNKIDKYKSCTFHTRYNFKQQSLNTSKIV